MARLAKDSILKPYGIFTNQVYVNNALEGLRASLHKCAENILDRGERIRFIAKGEEGILNHFSRGFY